MGKGTAGFFARLKQDYGTCRERIKIVTIMDRTCKVDIYTQEKEKKASRNLSVPSMGLGISGKIPTIPCRGLVLFFRKRLQGIESFRDQAGLRMTYTPRHPARSLRFAPLTCENLRHPATAYNMGFID
jgi:hypothetical protein